MQSVQKKLRGGAKLSVHQCLGKVQPILTLLSLRLFNLSLYYCKILALFNDPFLTIKGKAGDDPGAQEVTMVVVVMNARKK